MTRPMKAEVWFSVIANYKREIMIIIQMVNGSYLASVKVNNVVVNAVASTRLDVIRLALDVIQNAYSK